MRVYSQLLHYNTSLPERNQKIFGYQFDKLSDKED